MNKYQNHAGGRATAEERIINLRDHAYIKRNEEPIEIGRN